MDDFSYTDYSEMMRDARRGPEREREELEEKAANLNNFLKMMEAADELLADRDRWQQEAEALREQLQDEKQQRAELEMKLMEMSKLSTGMAKKASEDNLLKALRTYVSRSKRKTADKRAFAKSATLEIANANGLDLPEDLKAAIESLDDEQTELKVVNVSGNYNDVHDNGEVSVKH